MIFKDIHCSSWGSGRRPRQYPGTLFPEPLEFAFPAFDEDFNLGHREGVLLVKIRDRGPTLIPDFHRLADGVRNVPLRHLPFLP